MTGLESWSSGRHTFDGVTHPTYRRGSGPAVVVVHEVPGLTADVIAFAEEVVAGGFTVVLPHLFGDADGHLTVPAALKVVPRLCVSREFTVLARNQTRPARSRAGCALWRVSCTRNWVGRVWVRWGCASPVGSRWR